MSRSRRPSMPIEERLRIAGWLVVRTKIFHDVWRYYHDALNEEGKAHFAMNLYTEFFRFDQHAQFVSFLIYAAALLEERPDTINLPALVNQLKDGQLLSDTIEPDIDALLKKALAHRGKILLLRSNLFAHRSASLTYSDAFKKASITPNQLRASTEAMLSLSNRLLFSQGMKDNISHDLPVVDVKAIHNALYQCNLLGLT